MSDPVSSAFRAVVPVNVVPTAIWVIVAAAVVLFFAGRVLPLFSKSAPYRKKPLLNKSELRLYSTLLRWTRQNRPNLHVSCQVSYGEFLSHRSLSHFRKINSKRADFVIFDNTASVLAVVEFDGSGHWGGSTQARRNAERRDRIKDAAVRSAGIPMIRIGPADNVDGIAARLSELIPPSRRNTGRIL